MKIKKFLSAFLVCVMVVSSMSTVAFASETSVSSFDDLKTALTNAVNGNVITLSASITATEAINATDVTIDLGGKTLQLADNANNYFRGTTTIKNGTISVDDVEVGGDCIIGIGDRNGDATLNLEDVNITGSNYSSAFAVLMVYGNSTLNITNGEWTLSNEKSSAGGVIKNQNGAGNSGNVNITGTKMTFDNISRGISGSTAVLDGVEMTITGGDNGINGAALTVKNSTLNISGGTGRALTVTDNDIVVENSTLNFSNNAEADIRFKTANKLTMDASSTLSNCTVFANKTGATINGKEVTGTEEAPSKVTVNNGETTIKPVVKGLSGEGTEASPFLINNIDELKWFRDDVNAGNTYDKKYVQLNTNIDLNNEEWTPIGFKGATFKGNFDGASHTIKNLAITKTLTNSSENNNIGFFGRTDSPATITNLTIENVDITGSLYVGAVVGLGYTGNKIENCTVKGDIAIDAWWYAGVIGGNGYMNLVNNCHVIGNVGSYVKGNNGSYIGGIWGFRGEGGQKITNCSVTNLSISGVDRVGGIAGIGHYGNVITGCSASNVTVQAEEGATTVGLIVGACQGTASEPTVFESNDVSGVTAKAGETEVTSLYGTNISGTVSVTNYVAQVGNTAYATLEDAIKASKDGDTITLISGDTPISAAGSIYGKNITITGSAVFDWSKGWLFVGRGGEGDATLTFDNATIKAVESSLSNGSYGIHVSAKENGSTTKNNGTVIFKNSDVQLSYLANRNNVTVDGGKLYVDYGFWVGGRPASETPDGLDGKATMDVKNGAVVEVKNHNGMGIGHESIGTLNIENGATFNYTGSSFEITSKGEFNNKGTVNGNLNVNGKLISSGNVSGTITKASDAAVIEVSGGTYTQDVTDWCADGFEVVKNDDNTYTVVATAYVAKIGDTMYTSLQAAVDEAQEDDVIVIENSFELGTIVTVAKGKKITLDLNGKTITGTDNTEKNFSLIDNRGDLTITGNGTMTLTATVNSGWNRYSAVLANNPGGKLTIENGTIQHLGGTDMAYGIDNLTNGKGTYAETIINGGTIKSTYRGIRQFLNGIEAQNILTVNGGTVEGANKSIWMHDPSKNANTGTLTVTENATLNGDVYLFVTEGSTQWPVTVSIAKSAVNGDVLYANVPEGYEVVEENGTYGVVEKTEKPALPTATVTEAVVNTTIQACDYGDWSNVKEIPLTFQMNFKADDPTDPQREYYSEWLADYELVINKDVRGVDGYLAGQYDSFLEHWVKLGADTEDVVLPANTPIKIIKDIMGLELEYETDILGWVKDFDCGIYLTPEFIEANPDLEITLALKLYNPENTDESYVIGEAYNFDAEDAKGEEEEEKDIFGGTFAIINMEPTMENHYLISIYSGIDSLNYKEVGFEIHPELLGYAITKSTNTVYTSITVPSLDGSTSQVVGLDKVGNAYRMFGTNVQLPVAYDNSTIYYRAYAIDLSGNPIYGGWYEIDDIYTLSSEEVSE